MGMIKVNDILEFKVARDVDIRDSIVVSNVDNYASLGGIKLKKALDYFNIDVANSIAIDIGASNGGFTDVLLKQGAKKVFAVDVSDCALPEEIKSDERVFVRDNLNARSLTFEDLGIIADIITIDVSFISLKLILPALLQFMDYKTKMIALIKPQFEVGRKHLSKSGVVLKQKITDEAVKGIIEFAKGLKLKLIGVVDSPHPFRDKNREYLAYFSKENQTI
jgi:23S rRNA (cytidine1920-2'-O)/16S rRNA (cytidine1409-2'-O)-methyltransferase